MNNWPVLPTNPTLNEVVNAYNYIQRQRQQDVIAQNSLTAQFLGFFPNQTTLIGTTAGTVVWSMPFQAVNYKKFAAVFSGYKNDTVTNQTITFPVPFLNTPVASVNNTMLTVSVTTTVLTITSPDSNTAYNGTLILEGI